MHESLKRAFELQVKKTNTVLIGHQILFPAWIGGQIFEAKTTICMSRQIRLSRRQLNTTHDTIECVQLLDGMLKDVMCTRNSSRKTNFIYDLLKIRERKCGLNVSSYLLGRSEPFQTDHTASKKEY